MATITLKGQAVQTSGTIPAVGAQAIDFRLTAADLSEKTLSDYKGKRVVLNVFPSVDTGTCAASVRQFNKAASGLENTEVLCVSKDLPFAQARFCGAEGLDSVTNLSDFRSGSFGKDYGLTIVDGPLENLLSRVVLVIDTNGKVLYAEQVPEIVDEPNYEAALKSLN